MGAVMLSEWNSAWLPPQGKELLRSLLVPKQSVLEHLPNGRSKKSARFRRDQRPARALLPINVLDRGLLSTARPLGIFVPPGGVLCGSIRNNCHIGYYCHTTYPDAKLQAYTLHSSTNQIRPTTVVLSANLITILQPWKEIQACVNEENGKGLRTKPCRTNTGV